MTTLDDFQQIAPRYCFISIRDPAPIVRGAVEGPDGGWYWLATPEQARRVCASEYAAVMREGWRRDKAGEPVHNGFHFSMLPKDGWEPDPRDLVCTSIPAELIA